MEHYGLLVKMTAIEDSRDALSRIMVDAARLMEGAPGCLNYLVHLDQQDQNVIWITEVWDSEALHDQSMMIDGVGALIGKARPMIAGMETTKLKTLPLK